MGLDVDFFIPGHDESIVSLRKQGWFFDQFHDVADDLVDDNFTDFYVDEEAIGVVIERVIAELEDHDLDPAKTPSGLPDADKVWCEDDHPWEILLHFYLALLEDLRQAAIEHGPLICAWSA